VQQTDWIGVYTVNWLNWCFCDRLNELEFVQQTDWIGVCVTDWFNWLLCSKQVDLVFVWLTELIDFCVANLFNWFFVAEGLNWFCVADWSNWFFVAEGLNWFFVAGDWIGVCVPHLSGLVCVAVWLNSFLCGGVIESLRQSIAACGCSLFYSQTQSNKFCRLVQTPCTSPDRSLSSPLSCWSWDCTAGLPTAWLLR